MNMIEKMARAMCKADGSDPDYTVRIIGDERDPLWREFEIYAKAALECLKEPTKDMKAEMTKFTGSQDIAHECFRLGIQAALDGK